MTQYEQSTAQARKRETTVFAVIGLQQKLIEHILLPIFCTEQMFFFLIRIIQIALKTNQRGRFVNPNERANESQGRSPHKLYVCVMYTVFSFPQRRNIIRFVPTTTTTTRKQTDGRHR